jgi:hypothetical protein
MTEQTQRDYLDPIETENVETEAGEFSEEEINGDESLCAPPESEDKADDTGDKGDESFEEKDFDDGFDAVSYEELARRDLEEIRSKFPEARGLRSITALPNALRYAELRDLGLSPTEAYLATGRLRPASDNRAHLNSKVPKGSSERGSFMKLSELNSARELFSSLSDEEIQRLYKRVNG